jgi:uncharacterized 2Fe-2S/4Fe-4S cluster protein (DUF4445 family)
LGVDIDSVCGGRGLCGRCQIELSEGEFAKHGITSSAAHLSSLGEVEQHYAETQGLKPGRRLSCSTLLLGDAVIDVPPDSQVHRQVVRKRAEVHAIQLDPVVRLYYVDVQEPDMHDPSSDLRRLEEALEFEWRLTDLRCDVRVLQQLQQALRQGTWKVTVAVHNDNQLIAVWPGFRDKAYGLAVDVGSTTIAGHLCELASGEVIAAAGVMNPQIRCGEDLMSRVSYIMMHSGGEQEMSNGNSCLSLVERVFRAVGWCSAMARTKSSRSSMPPAPPPVVRWSQVLASCRPPTMSCGSSNRPMRSRSRLTRCTF